MGTRVLCAMALFIFFVTSCSKDESILPEKEEPEEEIVDYKTFKTIDGEAVIEAENYSSSGGSKGSWSLETSTGGYLGSGYMLSSEDEPQLQFDTAICKLSYVIDFDQIGTYYVHLRTYSADHNTNGFFATIDGEEIDYGGANPENSALVAYYIYVEKIGRWLWYTDGGGAETRNLKVSFELKTSGKHTFTIYRRDTGSKLDHIWITKHESNPQRVENLNLPSHLDFIVDNP